MTLVERRFKKNYKLDGWPIEDTSSQVVLHTDDLVVILNEQAQRIKELEAEEVKVNKGLLRLSDECPGAYSHFYKAYQET